jgi:4-amino-4-deoxy-L-arabinose transferase-like glycosyltransferase
MRSLLWSLFLAMLLTGVAVISRPLLPVDETRYLTVAWEAHQDGDYLVSHLNGETYAHKPPLLFWMINAVWSLTGVYALPARLIAPTAGLCCLLLTMMIAKRLWPDSGSTIRFSPLILVSSMLWMIFSPLTMFDTLLTCSTLAALLGVLRAANGSPVSGWLLAGTAAGIGILSKGPVIFVHVLPVALAAPVWMSPGKGKWVRWYAGFVAAVMLAAIIGLSWALPAAAAGGDAYASELLYGQTAGRMVQSFAHDQMFWWYLPWLPVCVMPWILFGPVWRGFRQTRLDPGLRFVLIWAAGSLIILSLVSGKQIHYLMPAIPALSLALSRILASSVGDWFRRDILPLVVGTAILGLMPVVFNHVRFFGTLGLAGIVADRYSFLLVACGLILLFVPVRNRELVVSTIATSATLFCCVVVGSLWGSLWHGFDLKPLAEFAADCERPLAWYSDYQGQIGYLGSVRHVEEVRTEEDLRSWIDKKPNGAVVIRLSTSRNQWAEILPLLRSIDRSSPDSLQQETLTRFFSSHPAFPLAKEQPVVLYVQWIQRGLTRSPYLIVSYHGSHSKTAL